MYIVHSLSVIEFKSFTECLVKRCARHCEKDRSLHKRLFFPPSPNLQETSVLTRSSFTEVKTEMGLGVVRAEARESGGRFDSATVPSECCESGGFLGSPCWFVLYTAQLTLASLLVCRRHYPGNGLAHGAGGGREVTSSEPGPLREL